MKKILFLLIILIVLSGCLYKSESNRYCMTGAFLADRPTAIDIANFKSGFGKKPYLIMIFLGWGDYPGQQVTGDISESGCVPVFTLEPWDAVSRKGVDLSEIISGKFDSYLKDFALQLKKINGPVFFRFAHEPNGDWYPWSGDKVGKDKYIAAYRHVYNVFKNAGALNVRWVFSINWEDIPKENKSFILYPGDGFVDYIGLDGYNWGNTQPWSRWMSFEEIFSKRYNETVKAFNKPILITEFSSVSSGGDKAAWIREALLAVKKMKMIKGIILFNIDKEGDWSFRSGSPSGIALRRYLADDYFIDSWYNKSNGKR